MAGQRYVRPGKARRKKGARHLKYEYLMFRRTFGLYFRGPPPGVDPAEWINVRRALLESLLIHTRALISSFRGNRSSHSKRTLPDILFRDYLHARTWARLQHRLRRTKRAYQWERRIGRFVAHPSYARDYLNQPPRWHGEMFRWVHRRMRLWYGALDRETRGWFSGLEEFLS